MMLTQVQRRQSRMRLAIAGDHSTGKTLSALLAAYGLTGSWEKVALIDTELGSASYHAYVGRYSTVQIGAPFTPEKFMQAIRLCEEAGMEAIVIDSISDEFVGEGGITDLFYETPGTDDEKWTTAMSLHHEFLERLHASPAHLICTLRMQEGRIEQDPRILNHFTVAVQLDRQYRARVLKDRTSLLDAAEPAVITSETGAQLFSWCNQGAPAVGTELAERIESCSSMYELLELMGETGTDDPMVLQALTRRRRALEDGVGAACGKRELTVITGGL
jgi:hypothetical protein